MRKLLATLVQTVNLLETSLVKMSKRIERNVPPTKLLYNILILLFDLRITLSSSCVLDVNGF